MERQPSLKKLGGINQVLQETVPTKVYNKQIINNKFPVKSPTPCSNLLLHQCNPMNPMQFDVPFVPTLGPALCKVSPQEVCDTPYPQPLTNNNNFDQGNVSNQTAQTLSNRFKKYAEIPHTNLKQTGVIKYQHQPRDHGYQFQNNTSVDLRLYLYIKRKLKILKEYHERTAAGATDLKVEYSQTNQDGIQDQAFQVEKRRYSLNSTEMEVDDDTEQGIINSITTNYDNLLDEEFGKTQDYTNSLEALRGIFEIPENQNVWYIVTDSNVLLYNIHFLNNILNADNQCRLMIPEQVMKQIQIATITRLRPLAQKTLYFILNKVEDDLAIIDKSSEEIDNSNDDILNCCALHMARGIHVVLLTDDIELHNNSNTSNMHIFAVSEIKHLLKEFESNVIPTNNLDTVEIARDRNIRITINNETNIKSDDDASVPLIKEGIPHIYPEIGEGTCEKLLSGSVSLPKISDDINNEIILTKPNDSLPCNISGVQRQMLRDLCKTKNTNKKKVRGRHKHNSSINVYHDEVDNSVTSIFPVTDSSTIEKTSDVENLTWGWYSDTSTESPNKKSPKRNDMSSETSSITVNRNVYKNSMPHVTIDETSISNMSNTTSFMDNGSEMGGFQKMKMDEDKNVMFEITDVRMEEFLRTKSDEWVSRLVQIMEEALTQVLRLGALGFLEHMPPPWTVHEAAECIKKEFHNDSDVVDAASKFLQISLENGGLRGKIQSSINPNKFMELYSYSVYLIDALQGALIKNEDLQTAAESLFKLLNDIQDPQLDPTNQDSFNSITVQENETKDAEDNDTTKGIVNPDDINKNKKTETPKLSPNSIRLAIKKIIEMSQVAPDKITITKNVGPESSFISRLHLKKNSNLISDSKITIKEPNPIIGLGTSDEIKKNNDSPSIHENEENVNTPEKITSKLVNEEPKMNEPKLIRKFSICPKYEERFKSKYDFISGVEADTNKEFEGSMINYEEEEEFEEDYNGTDEYHGENEDYDMDDNDVEWPAFGHSPEKTEGISSVLTSNSFHINSKNESLTFKRLMETFEKDIQRAYSSIQDFCVKSCESLQTPDLSAADTTRMQLRAEKTYIYIHQICHQLNSVLTRENSDQGIFEILKRKEFKDIKVEDNDMEDYRNFIGNCLEQGKVLRDSITLVLEASKDQTG